MRLGGGQEKNEGNFEREKTKTKGGKAKKSKGGNEKTTGETKNDRRNNELLLADTNLHAKSH